MTQHGVDEATGRDAPQHETQIEGFSIAIFGITLTPEKAVMGEVDPPVLLDRKPGDRKDEHVGEPVVPRWIRSQVVMRSRVSEQRQHVKAGALDEGQDQRDPEPDTNRWRTEDERRYEQGSDRDREHAGDLS